MAEKPTDTKRQQTDRQTDRQTILAQTLNALLPSSAFTLAEVLITLGIIGIVASMTIPTLINKKNDAEFKAAYKKAYSTASQAWLSAYSKGNLTICSSWSDSGTNTCNADNFNAFKQEFKVSKDCGTDTANCWDMTGEKSWGDAFPSTNAQAFIDSSGMAWSKLYANPAPEVLIDTNGNKQPNKYGKDRAIFVLKYSPFVVSYPEDFPNSITSTTEQQYRCPSIITDSSYHCYYTSWITGAQ